MSFLMTNRRRRPSFALSRLGRRSAWVVLLPVCGAAAGTCAPAAAQTTLPDVPLRAPSYNDFGGAGLLQLPSARAQESGTMAAGLSHVSPYWRAFATLQVLPWLEATFRYTSITGVPYNQFYTDADFKDRSFDLKIRFMEETPGRPSGAIGFRDIGGTGLFSSEYLVFSKRLNKFDLSAGIAWGNMAARGQIRNPLAFIDTLDGTRDAQSIGGLGGNYFRGRRAGLFAGVEYTTPLDGLSLFAEYDSNDYTLERFSGTAGIKPASMPFNVGANYDVTDAFRVGVAYERGNALMLRGNVRFNVGARRDIVPPSPPPAVPPRPVAQEARPPEGLTRRLTAQEAVRDVPSAMTVAPSLDRLFDRLEDAGLELRDVAIRGDTMEINVAMASDAPEIMELAQAALAVEDRSVFGPIDKVVFVGHQDDGTAVRQVIAVEDLKRSVAMTGTPHLMLPPANDTWRRFIASYGGPAPLPERLEALMAPLALEASEIVLKGATMIIVLPPATPMPAADRLAEFARQLGRTETPLDAVTLVQNTDGRAVTMTFPTKTRPAADAATEVADAEAAPDRPVRSWPTEQVEAVFDMVRHELSGMNMTLVSLELNDATVRAFVEQGRYRNPAPAFGRIARVLARHVPADIGAFDMTLTEDALPAVRMVVPRHQIEALARGQATSDEVWLASETPRPVNPSDAALTNWDHYPAFSWGLSPRWRQHVGGGDNFYAWQLYALLTGSVRPMPGLTIAGAVGQDIANTFDSLADAPVSSLPHVRSDIVKYLQASPTWLHHLKVSYESMIAPDVYAMVSGGILEEMYAGYGGEVLYRPHGEPWAVGVNLYRAHKRGFERRFGLLDYKVTTGHASFYYDVPYYGIGVAVHAGRYLAGDTGATLELSRTFESGAQVGVWATKTNVSAEQFGEGQFDKGFSIRIPLEVFTGRASRIGLATAFRPLTKDGGQMLGGAGGLYGKLNKDMTDDRLSEGWHDVAK